MRSHHLLLTLALGTLLPGRSSAQTVDIAVYGACGSGDRTAQAQAALDATPNGGTTFFSCITGTNGLRLHDRTNITLRGDKIGGIRAVGAGGEGQSHGGPFMLAIKRSHGIKIQGMKFDGGEKDVLAVGIEDARNPEITGSEFYNGGAVNKAGQITTVRTHNLKILDNTFRGSQDNAMIWAGNAYELTDWSPTISRNRFIPGPDGVVTRASTVVGHSVNATITDNKIPGKNCCAAIKNVIENPRAGPGRTPVGGVTRIANNRLSGGQGNGIQFDFGPEPAPANWQGIIEGNQIDDFGQSSFYNGGVPNSGCGNVILRNNHFGRTGTLNNAGNVQFHNCAVGALTIHGNTILNGSFEGIAFQTGNYGNVSITCNKIQNSGRAGFSPAGGRLASLTFYDNSFVGSGTDDVNFRASVGSVSSARNSFTKPVAGVRLNRGTPTCQPKTPPRPPPPPQPSPPARLWGDVDGDSEIDSVDALLVLRAVIRRSQPALVDVDADELVTSTDGLLILH